MAPPRISILAFVDITGASESVAAQKLEEYDGNLNEAIDSYFSEQNSDHQNSAAPTFASAIRTLRPSRLHDLDYRRKFYRTVNNVAFLGHPPVAYHEKPVLYVRCNDRYEQPRNFGCGHAREEDQMIQAAIKASKKDHYLMNMQNSCSNTTKEEKALSEPLLQGLKLQESSSTGWSSSNRSEKGEKMFTSKQDTLPLEPPSDDIIVAVHMLDGTRNKCRFLKSDKLQLLFDFINISGAMVPGSYRIMIPYAYPPHAYSVRDSSLTLSEIGLIGKEEVVFVITDGRFQI